MMELYKKHRPKEFSQLRGQPNSVKILEDMEKSGFPHAILLTGPSGCGKTTVARIIGRKLGCKKGDFQLVNASKDRGIDAIRNIEERMSLSAWGSARVWFFDECQGMVTLAQQALLCMLEDQPEHVWFLLATTDPGKLLKTVRGRCAPVKLDALPVNDMLELLNDVAKAERIKLSREVAERIEEVSDGSARKALVLLEKIARVDSDKARLSLLEKEEHTEAIELARLLINPKSKWSAVAELLKTLDAEPEDTRRSVLGYARAVLLGGRANRAYLLICAFEGNFYDSGAAGLARACWEVYRDKSE